MKDDKQIAQYLKNVENFSLGRHDEVSALIWEIVDVEDDWDSAV